MLTVPIAFNINDITSQPKIVPKVATLTSDNIIGCGIKTMNSAASYVVSAISGEIKVGVELIKRIFTAEEIAKTIVTAPIAFSSTNNFQPLADNGISSLYLGTYTLEEASKVLTFYASARNNIISISTVALAATGVGVPAASVTKVAGFALNSLDLFTQLQEALYCFYGYDESYKFAWYLKYGSILVPVPIDPSTLNPIISSITSDLSFVTTDASANLVCNATDPRGTPLKYYWPVTGGSILGSGPSVVWKAPSTAGNYTVTCYTSNGKNISSKGLDIKVIDSFSPITINSVNTSTSSINPGDTVTITYNVTNSGSSRYAILEASFGFSGTNNWPISASATDNKVNIISGTSSISRLFTFPTNSIPGNYDLHASLWEDSNSNNCIDVNTDKILSSINLRPAIGIQSNSVPGNFNLSANAYCNMVQPVGPAIVLEWNTANGATSYDIYRNGSLYKSSVTGKSFDNNSNVIAGQTYTYYLKATNTSGWSESNTATINVASNVCTSNSTLQPTISDISPKTMTANGQSQNLVIYGSNFATGNVVQFKWGQGAGANVWTNSNATPTVNSSGQITVSMNPGTVTDTIYVRVGSNGSYSSETQYVSVTAPVITVTPSVSSISPTSMTANGQSQNLVIYGSNFATRNVVQFKWGQGAGANVWTNSNATPTVNSSGQITVSMNPGTVTDTIYVRVGSNGSYSSETRYVSVTAPAVTVTPSVSSISPTSMTASTTALTTLTVNGSNFSTSGGHLQFTDPFGSTYSSASHPERVVSVTSTKWVYQINNGGTVGTWQVKVVNSNGQSSNATSFTVH